jgi:hypothetical protein
VLLKCIRLGALLDSCNTVLADSALTFLESEQNNKKKEAALDRLLANTVGLMAARFTRWREAAAQLAMQARMGAQQKADIMARLESFLSSSGLDLLKQSLALFHTNYKVNEVQKRFFSRLLSEKAGMSARLLQLWQTIPEPSERERMRRAHVFFRRIKDFALSGLAQTMRGFKHHVEEGELSMKRAVILLIRAS